jgi:hypothetical protein
LPTVASLLHFLPQRESGSEELTLRIEVVERELL